MQVFFTETITRLHIPLADAPFFEIPAHALQLHFELACVPHGVAVPGMGGGELRQQVDKPLAQSTLGQVGILHIHKVFGVKTADGFEIVSYGDMWCNAGADEAADDENSEEV